jgi:phosphoribosyl 1,2-cyclic phosphodiesterase
MSTPLQLRVVFLGSGSSGNATAITDGTTTVLVDCGFSAREVSRRLCDAGIEPHTVTGLLVTHEHSDHVRGIDVFVRRHAPGCTVYATCGTLRARELSDLRTNRQEISPGETMRVGTLDVVAFATSHDAAQPVGYRLDSNGDSVAVATDTGVLTEQAVEALADVRVLGLESNHDLRMLERGPYPAFLKHRIRSTRGHLSNTDAADALERLASDRLEQVFALHRSTTNNTVTLAETLLRDRAGRIGLDIQVTVASQALPCESCASPSGGVPA